MTAQERQLRQQLLREAEGYLELLMSFGEPLSTTTEHRDQVALRGLAVLDRLSATTGDSAAAHELRGMLLRAMERYAEAIPHLQYAAQMQQQNLHLWLSLGWCYKRVKRLDAAIEALESALVNYPAEAILHYNLACYHSLAGDKSPALKHLEKAFDLDPEYRNLVHAESDFEPLRNDPDFRRLATVLV